MIINLNKKITCSLCEQTKSEDYYTLAQTLEKNPVCESCQDELTAGSDAATEETLTREQWTTASAAFRIGYTEAWDESYYFTIPNRNDPSNFYRDSEFERHLDELPSSTSVIHRLAEIAILAAIAGFIALPWLAQ